MARGGTVTANVRRLDGAAVKIGDLLYVKHHAADTRFVTAACPDPSLALFFVVALAPFTSCDDTLITCSIEFSGSVWICGKCCEVQCGVKMGYMTLNP
jgi:hypothetical protein